jgi:hypothetical protein
MGYWKMPEGTNKKNNQEKEESSLNKLESNPIPVNRGVELLLRNRRRRPEPPKTFQIKFGNLVSFFKREIVFHFNFYLDIRRKK